MNTSTYNQEETIQPNATEIARGYVTPTANIVETGAAYILEAEMPGVAREGLTVLAEGNVLTLVGRRQPLPEGTHLYGESAGRDYRRVFELDPSVDASRISARLEQGVLTVTLPKAEKAKPRQIKVD